MPLCMGCLNEISRANATCRVCGFDNSQSQQSPFLPYGTILNGKYVVAKNLDTNGESTRYLGYNNDNGKVVTIREFLPIGLFDRGKDETKLFVSPNDKLKFSRAMSDFQSYYENVSSVIDKSAMTEILDSFAENNTAYVIEENIDWIPFSQYLENNGGHLEWDVVFEPGELKAVGYRNGIAILTDVRRTPGTASRLKLRLENASSVQQTALTAFQKRI